MQRVVAGLKSLIEGPLAGSDRAEELNGRGLEANRHGETSAALGLLLQAHTAAPADARFILSAANMHLKLGQPTEACVLYKKLESLSLTSRQSEIARSKQSAAASMTPREHQTPREQPTEAPGRPGLRSGVNSQLETAARDRSSASSPRSSISTPLTTAGARSGPVPGSRSQDGTSRGGGGSSAAAAAPASRSTDCLSLTATISSGRVPPTLLARLGVGSFAAVWSAREASGKLTSLVGKGVLSACGDDSASVTRPAFLGGQGAPAHPRAQPRPPRPPRPPRSLRRRPAAHLRAWLSRRKPPEPPLSVARLVAVKVMPLPIDTKEGELQKELRSEILLMRSFTHRNVSALHAAAHAHPCTRRRTHTHAHAPYSL